MSAVIQYQPGAVQTAAEVKAHVQLIQRVMTDVMKPEVHYGNIPGTDKPTLLKAGSEVLLSTFRLAVEPEVEDLSTHDEVRYRVRAIGRHQTSGTVIGMGLGECSSSEEKYRWRNAVCQEEFDATAEDRRRLKYQKGRDGSVYTRMQVRTVPADTANTVLKMAKKRAQVDLCLTALAASDCFAQDLEDMPEELRDAAADTAPRATKPATQAPRAAAGGPKLATEKQLKLIGVRLGHANLDSAQLCDQFGVTRLEELRFDQVDPALQWIAEAAEQ